VATLDDAVHRLARGQRLVVARGQIRALGGTDDWIEVRLASGRWNPVQAGVYLVTPGSPDWYQRGVAGLLACEGHGALSHRAGVALHELDGGHRTVVELSSDAPHHPRLDGVVLHRTQRWNDEDLCMRQGMRVTTVARTLIDYGAVAPPGLVELALEYALRRELTTEAYLQSRLLVVGGRGCRGSGVLRTILDVRPPGRPARSALEIIFTDVARLTGLPMPERNALIYDGDEVVAEADFLYAPRRVIVETSATRTTRRRSSGRPTGAATTAWSASATRS
jgi:hypothetical protein